MAVANAATRYGPRRIGLFIGTSTSGIQETEHAYRAGIERGAMRVPAPFRFRFTHDVFSVAAFSRDYLHLAGPAVVVSTACSSSAKVFALASRYIRAGLCDAAIVGGVDSLCLTTLYGFHSLELLSESPCQPWDAERKGLNIGEAAGFALLECASADASGIFLIGYGESSDAYHVATPHPEGRGAYRAMHAALDSAGVVAEDIDYINLHGTATRSNDAAEDKAITTLFGTRVPCSSTKGWTGHTLGAAGITEALISALALRHNLLPRSLNTERLDPALRATIVMRTEERPLRRVLSNSFGFGGNNCSLLFGKA
jgi:3-oxoacyl-[acyl-carrier-protein] synthase-1